MKLKGLIACLIIALILFSVALFYRKRGLVFSKKLSSSPRRILFVGDSITAAEYCYSYVIKKLLPEKQIDVLAKGGMRTQWMLDNLKDRLRSGSRYDRVYIWGGS